jgi:hypothetical protein
MRRKISIRGLLWPIAVTVVVFGCSVVGQRLQAAPVTFAFDAEVTSVYRSPSLSFELPFEVSVGDTIHGRFTFEPAPLGRMGRQDLGMQFEISGVKLHSPIYDLRIFLNQYPPDGFEPFEPLDHMFLSCSPLSGQSGCFSGTVPGASHITWRPFMSLSANSPLLNNHDLIGDPEVWNQFSARSIELSFASTGGLVFFGAAMGSIVAVPEPHSVIIASCGMIAAVLRSPRIVFGFC